MEPENPQQPPPEGYGRQTPPPEGRYGPPPSQGQYGRPAPGQYESGAPATASSRGRPNITALILAIIAAVLGVLSLFVLAWYRNNFSSFSGGQSATQQSKFTQIHDALKQAQATVDANPTVGKYLHFGISPTYFSWLGYVLIAAAVVLAIISALVSGGAAVAVKFVSALVALVGLAATFWAIDLVRYDSQVRSQIGTSAPSGYGDWLKHTSFGAWAMMLAFLLCFIASLLPPKRRVFVEPADDRRY